MTTSTADAAAATAAAAAAALKADTKDVLKDVTEGKDALGAIVKVASKKDKRIDFLCHFMNPIGFECADRNRVPILALACLLAVGAFGCALCGSFGLAPWAMRSLEWGGFDDVPFSQWDLMWWYCGERWPGHEPAGWPINLTTGLVISPDCARELLSADNRAFYSDFGPLHAGLAHAGIYGCDASAAAGSCANNYEVFAGSMNMSYFHTEITRVDWHMNQWGFCLFPRDTVWHGESFVRAAMLGAADGRKMDLFEAATGGICRPWDKIAEPWMNAIVVRDCAQALRGSVDWLFFMAQVMCVFGSFMLIPTAISRMNPRLDQHHKTITLIILGTANIVPNLCQILQFNSQCQNAMTNQFGGSMGKDAKFGTGVILFTIGFGMSFPSLILHLIIPSATKSAFDPESASRRPSQDIQMLSEAL